MRKIRILIIFALAMAVISVVCLTIGIVLWFSADHKETSTFNDSDLIPVRVEVPVESNAFWTLIKATNALYWPESQERELNHLSDNRDWDDALAGEVLEKNHRCLDLFDEAMRQPFLLVPQPKSPVEEYPYLVGWRTIGRVESIRCVALFREKKEKEAFASAFKLVQFGQRVEDSGGPILHYLVGSAIKNSGLHRIRQMIPQTTLPATDLVMWIDELDRFKSNKEGFINALKVEYQTDCMLINEYAAGKIASTNKEEQGKLSMGMKVFLNPTKTKMKLAQADRVLLDNVSKPYGEIPWSGLPVIETNTSFFGTVYQFIEGNALGNLLFEMLELPLKTLAARKSREEVNVAATQLLLAMKIYKMQHGKLPDSLSELVPEFFSKVPTDNFDGKPFRYLPDKKLIYSVGPDLKDFGGKAFKPYSKDYDLPFRIEF